MNNQAAQTMPELPYELEMLVARLYADAYQTGHDATVEGHFIDLHPNDRDTYWLDILRENEDVQNYAAALSQPAGGADGWKLVPVEPTEVMCEAAMSSLGWTRSEAAAKTAPITPASPMMEGSMKVWSAMLAAAPAASGGDGTSPSLKQIVPAEKRNYLDENGNPHSIEDEAYSLGWNACRSATLKAIAKSEAYPHPPSGASVSERAPITLPVIADDVAERCRTFATGRLVELAMEISGRYAMWGTKVLHDALLAYRNEIQQRIAKYEALEQALAQQHALSSPRQEGEEGAVSGTLESLVAQIVASFPMVAIVRAFDNAAQGMGAALTSPTTGADGESLMGRGG